MSSTGDHVETAAPGEDDQRTFVLPPKQRVFMPQTRRERAAQFVWNWVRVLLFRTSPALWNGWRILLLRIFGARIGSGVKIDASVKVEFPWNLTLGPGCTVAEGTILSCAGPVRIGTRVRISQYVHICTATHEYTRPDMRIQRCSATIGDETWIAADVFIGPDVTIGSHVVVGARSSVFSDLDDAVVAYGNPARASKSNEERANPVA
jgi:putative colanic acid biosynthesis acetyltransferase WcaF